MVALLKTLADWGGLVTLLGLAVGVLALWQATRAARNARSASEQARATRAALTKRNVAEEIRSARRLIELSIPHLSAKGSKAALALLQVAQGDLGLLIARRDVLLQYSQKDRLTLTLTQLKSASNELLRTSLGTESYALCRVAVLKALDGLTDAEGMALAQTDDL